MAKTLSRRKLLERVTAAGAGVLLDLGAGEAAAVPAPGQAASRAANAAQVTPEILPLTSTSEVIIPTSGPAFMKFSFDFPEPSVAFANLRFGFRLCTYENVYGLDPERITVEQTADGLELHCSQLTWAGGQEKAPGSLRARIRKNGEFVEWDVDARMQQPI
jgi:hypothetical protein